MECELILRHGIVFTGRKFEAKDVGIRRGKIAAIGKGLKGRKEIDCRGRLVLPAALDAHVHVRDFNEAYKEDWKSASRAAAHGGVSCLFDMPNNKGFAIDTLQRLRQKEKRALNVSLADFGLYALVDEASLKNLKALAKEAVGFKLYMAGSTNAEGLKGEDFLERVFRAAARTGKVLVVHAEDVGTNERFTRHARGREDALAHYDSRPNLSEAIAVHRALQLAKKYKTKLHVTHVSTHEALPLIELAKAGGVNVTADCSFTHLVFGLGDHEKKGQLLKVNPPVRTEADREALWIALDNGTIDFIASDHAPHTRKEKGGRAEDVPSGLPWLDHFLPALYKLAKERRIPLKEALPWVTERPAARFKVRGKGRIAKGFDADVVVFNPHKAERVSAKGLFSKCRWSPLEGVKLPGTVEKTLIRGTLVFDKGKALGKGFKPLKVKTG